MSYAQIETSMQSIIAAVSGLTTSTVTKGDDGILDKGVSACAIIEASGTQSGPTVGRLTTTVYQCKVTIYVRFSTRAATHSAFITLRDAVESKLRNYFPDVTNGVRNPNRFFVDSWAAEGDPVDIAMQNSPQTGPVFRAQTIRVTVRQTEPIGV